MSPRTYGYDRVKLADAYTVQELAAMAEAIRQDPASIDPGYGKGGLYVYNPSARKKLDNLSWATRNRQTADREAAA